VVTAADRGHPPAAVPGLAQRFSEIAARYPHRFALRLSDRAFTYTELDGHARALAGALQRLPSGTPAAVGVLAARSIDCYAGILAALYAGAAVVPLSPAFPATRTAAMMRAAGVGAVVVDAPGARVLAAVLAATGRLPAMSLDEAVAGGPTDPVCAVDPGGALPAPVGVRAGSVAYVLFTSGSTGRPKGVPVTHANMAHFLAVNDARYGFTPEDVFSQTFDCTFDLAMFDLFMAWGNAGTLVSTPPQAFLSLPDFVARNGITVWFSVPSAVGLVRRRGDLTAGRLPSLRWSLFCGEPLAVDDARAWQDAAPHSTVENLYGPTELTVACSAYRWSPASSMLESVNGIVPIGQIFPGLDHVIVDESGVAGDGPGELCVSGPQMFPGYLDPNDDEGRFLTAYDRRWYRTGDLVRSAGTAGLAYLGRLDHQTKVRGYRVELTELEWHARALPGVEAAIAVAVDSAADRRLALWYTGNAMPAGRLRAHLVSRVPEFMVPHFVWHVAELPLNDNRKVDRRALSELTRQRCTATGGALPTTAAQ
jgi:amino acid adenylation domain-containing protein